MQGIKSTSVSHTHYNMLDFILGGGFDELSESWGGSIKSFNTESFEIGKLHDEEINKALVSTEPLESLHSFLFCRFTDFECLDIFLYERFEKISFLFTAQMHVLVTNFIHINSSQVILHRLNSVWTVLLIWILLSQVFQDDFIL